MHADHIERQLRGVEPYSVAVARKMHQPLLYSRWRSQGQVHGADRLFLAAAPGAGNARDTDPKGAANAPSYALGERHRHFAPADPLRGDDFRRHVGPGGLVLVVEEDATTEKIGR